jgi:hypothetical protein
MLAAALRRDALSLPLFNIRVNRKMGADGRGSLDRKGISKGDKDENILGMAVTGVCGRFSKFSKGLHFHRESGSVVSENAGYVIERASRIFGSERCLPPLPGGSMRTRAASFQMTLKVHHSALR